MAFGFWRNGWLTNGKSTSGYAKWLLAPAVIVVAAAAYLAKKTRPLKPTAAALPSDDLAPISPILEQEPGEATSISLPEFEAAIAPIDDKAIGQTDRASAIGSLAGDLPVENLSVPATTMPNEIRDSPAPASPRWHKPVVIPYDQPLTNGVEPALAAPRQGRTARRTAAALAMIAVTAVLVYLAFGAMRSQSAVARTDSDALQASATVQPVADIVPSSIDPATLPVTQPAEPSPPAEGPDESTTAPAAPKAATAEPAAPARHHARSRRSGTTSHKTRAFLYKPY